MDCSVCVAKTKAQIRCAVTVCADPENFLGGGGGQGGPNSPEGV